MPKSKSRKSARNHRPTLSGPARILFAQMEISYADADEAEWDELRDHMGAQLELISAGSVHRREMLAAEFEKIRTNALHLRPARQVQTALAAGAGELVRDRGDGLEEWTVLAGERTVMAYVPAHSEDPDNTLARRALLAGRCPSCRTGATLAAGTPAPMFEVLHTARCAAANVFED